jgi:hypothetical protein
MKSAVNPASLFKKGLSENPKHCLDLKNLSSNPIGVINRRNGCGPAVAAQRLQSSGYGLTLVLKRAGINTGTDFFPIVVL